MHRATAIQFAIERLLPVKPNFSIGERGAGFSSAALLFGSADCRSSFFGEMLSAGVLVGGMSLPRNFQVAVYDVTTTKREHYELEVN